MHTKKLFTSGKQLDEASNALIMLHGRGASAENIVSLAPHLHIHDYAVIAPQATNHTWYPSSFLMPPSQNEPWLSSALDVLNEIVEDILSVGMMKENIYFLGFSQGACLTLEYVTRNATKWGGAVAFTGGLIGDKIYKESYKGDFGGTPIFIGSSDPDPHIPVERVHESVEIISSMNGNVSVKVYKNMGHTITQDEITTANTHVFASSVIR